MRTKNPELHDELAAEIQRRIFDKVGYSYEPLHEMAPRGNYNREDPFHIRYDHEGQTTYYFKVYSGKGMDLQMSRISLMEPKYEPTHGNTPPLILSPKDVDLLVNKLKSKPNNGNESTLLEHIINELNKHNETIENGYLIPGNIKPEDYYALKHKRPPR